MSGGPHAASIRGNPARVQAACSEEDCRSWLGNAGGLISGVSGFVGYSVTERLHLGLRGMGGFRLGGGFVAAAGPAISVRLWAPFWAGTSLLAGGMAAFGDGDVTGGKQPLQDVPMAKSTGLTVLTVGNGVELGLAVYEAESGSLLLQSTPAFLLASEIVFALPVALAYRFTDAPVHFSAG